MNTISIDEWKAAGLTYKQYKNDRSRGKLVATRATRNKPVQIEVDSIKDPAKKAKIIAKYGDPNAKSQLPAVPEDEPSDIKTVRDLPEDLRNRARAMWDILIELDAFLAEKEKSESMDSARKRFDDLYNKGFICTHVDRAIIDKVHYKTLYKWQDKLDKNDNNPYYLVKEREKKVSMALTEAHKKQLEQFFLFPNRYNYSECHREANRIFKGLGMPEVDYHTAYRHLEWFYSKNKMMCDSVRYSFTYAKNKYGHYITKDPNKCNYMDQIVGDGHTFNVQCLHPTKPGKLVRATLVAFVDERTHAWLGGAIGLSENTELIKLALYRSLVKCGEYAGLSSPAIPLSIKLDNGRAFRSKELAGLENKLMGEMGGLFARMKNYGLQHVSYSIPYNARSKIIERMFRDLNEFEKRWATYVGNKLVDKPGYIQRNQDYLRTQHAALIEAQGGIPTMDELFEAATNWMIEYNNRASNGEYLQGRSPFELIEEHRTAIDYRPRALPQKELLELLMDRKYLPIKKRGVTMWDIDYYSEELWNYTNANNDERYLVMGDPYDKSKVFLHHLDGSFWMALPPSRGTNTNPIIGVTGTEEDHEELAAGMKIQSHQFKKVKEQLAEIYGYGSQPENKKVLKAATQKALGTAKKELPAHDESDGDYVTTQDGRKIKLKYF